MTQILQLNDGSNRRKRQFRSLLVLGFGYSDPKIHNALRIGCVKLPAGTDQARSIL
jgi:hypothetical protein